ncbi:hypothetical protein V6N11_040253 [Hibiscus sabdariffa]|uniref:Transmembrane protein 220 n=1 Tax=Hibiscus sabdariffa TaxID=183260 RepID=A0ABR2RH77_9ROSI
MATPRKLFSCCSLLMAIMFGFSSSVQLNDPDWYFWFPLYACACIVNLLNWRISPKGSIKHIAEVVLCLGVFLFIKVVVEDFVTKKEEGSWESCCIWNGELRIYYIPYQHTTVILETTRILMPLMKPRHNQNCSNFIQWTANYRECHKAEALHASQKLLSNIPRLNYQI